jgi:tetratricopeptide (TPR) repeat protein
MTRFVKPAGQMVSRSAAGRALIVMAITVNLSGCFLFGGADKKTQEPVAEAPAPVLPAKPLVDKGDPDTRFKAALKLMKDHQPKEAQAAFVQLAADFPEFSGPLTDLGILYAQGKQRPAAIASFEKAVTTNPDNVVARTWLGSLYRENNEVAKSEAAYLKAIAVKPDYAPAHLDLGILYDAYLKRPQDALMQYREYQRIAGTDKLIVSAWIKELEAGTPATANPSIPGAHP